jgi:hypothetical protein
MAYTHAGGEQNDWAPYEPGYRSGSPSSNTGGGLPDFPDIVDQIYTSQGGGGGGGGGGGSQTSPAPNLDPASIVQNVQANPYQTNAYNKFEDIYNRAPDYDRVTALGRDAMAGAMKEGMAQAGFRGAMPGTGAAALTAQNIAQQGQRDLWGGLRDERQRIFENQLNASRGMGTVGGDIATNLLGQQNMYIDAFGQLKDYALGVERNNNDWYEAQNSAMIDALRVAVEMARYT